MTIPRTNPSLIQMRNPKMVWMSKKRSPIKWILKWIAKRLTTMRTIVTAKMTATATKNLVVTTTAAVTRKKTRMRVDWTQMLDLTGAEEQQAKKETNPRKLRMQTHLATMTVAMKVIATTTKVMTGGKHPIAQSERRLRVEKRSSQPLRGKLPWPMELPIRTQRRVQTLNDCLLAILTLLSFGFGTWHSNCLWQILAQPAKLQQRPSPELSFEKSATR
mmetsp:Transcript_20322/g.42601  ORF Transcript_20322/g.42601 Transcript_20322/m.42601 type:complete len:218 (+) Transcript_20322:83-736(+)